MADYFALELDTTGPDIEIFAPTYSTQDAFNEIIVQASELLVEWQQFYFMDARGERHDVIFTYDGDRYAGLVRFNLFPPGIATLYAQVQDEVFNPSPLRSKAINIIKGAPVTIEAGHQMRRIDAGACFRQLLPDLEARAVEVGRANRIVDCGADARRIEVGVGDV